MYVPFLESMTPNKMNPNPMHSQQQYHQQQQQMQGGQMSMQRQMHPVNSLNKNTFSFFSRVE